MQLLHAHLPNPDLLGSNNYFALLEKWWTTKSTPNLDSIEKLISFDLAKTTKFAILWLAESNYLELKQCKKLGSTTGVEQ